MDMCNAVICGAQLICSFGCSIGSLMVIPQNRIFCEGQPMAAITDHAPMVNILPFGMCSSLGNPNVAAATAAAQGVITPMPCIPLTLAPWSPGKLNLFFGNMPALTCESKLMCAYGGVISIVNPNQFTVILK
ncbi:MAG: DUF4280 domain-containing protein [Anaerovorax sp.]|nr:DUF4280 domain-containing protein [Anaerovorax sp.]